MRRADSGVLDRTLEETADLIAAFISGRDSSPGLSAATQACTFKIKKIDGDLRTF